LPVAQSRFAAACQHSPAPRYYGLAKIGRNDAEVNVVPAPPRNASQGVLRAHRIAFAPKRPVGAGSKSPMDSGGGRARWDACIERTVTANEA